MRGGAVCQREDALQLRVLDGGDDEAVAAEDGLHFSLVENHVDVSCGGDVWEALFPKRGNAWTREWFW